MITTPEILSGHICPYCGGSSQYVDSAVIYGRSYGMIYLCAPCDAYVGVHHKTSKDALGRLANAELREWKKHAHGVFDKLWKERHMNRTKAYRWLSQQLGIKKAYCHIGMFDVKKCKEVVSVCNRYLNKVKELA